MPLALAAILQSEERQSRSRKGETPFCENSRPYIQYTANGSRVFVYIQQKKMHVRVSRKSINFTTAANGLKRSALYGSQGDYFLRAISFSDSARSVESRIATIRLKRTTKHQVNSVVGVYLKKNVVEMK